MPVAAAYCVEVSVEVYLRVVVAGSLSFFAAVLVEPQAVVELEAALLEEGTPAMATAEALLSLLALLPEAASAD